MGIVSARIRMQVWHKCNGRCAYCGKPLALKQMQADHLQPCYWTVSDEDLIAQGRIRGADVYENLMPSCRRCNKWKDNYTIDEFRNEITLQLPRLKENVNAFRLVLDYGIIVEQEWDQKFYFEKMPGFTHTMQKIKG
jgi:5-methylcytosine-specific restriction endonuclease McrA